MHLIFDSHNSFINRLSDFVGKVLFNDLILNYTVFTDCGLSEIISKTPGLRIQGLISICTSIGIIANDEIN